MISKRMLEKVHYGPECRFSIGDRVAAVEAVGVSVKYEQGEAYALKSVDLKVKQGECVAILGANGAGKSTFLKAIAGLLPIRGKLHVFGQKAGKCRHKVAYLAQRQHIDWEFPVSLEKLVLAGRYVHLGWGKRARVCPELESALSLLELEKLRHRQIGQLSGGQQQRALLARTLVHDPELFLLDEPLNGVDAKTRALFQKLLGRLKEQKKTVLLAIHDAGPLDIHFDKTLTLIEGASLSQG